MRCGEWTEIRIIGPIAIIAEVSLPVFVLLRHVYQPSRSGAL